MVATIPLVDTVRSADGTEIAFERTGDGPPLLFVNGALSDHTSGAALARRLEAHRSVIVFDRRGRGMSGDTAPYGVDREIDDIAALLNRIGEAAVFAHSSGATLALRAAMRGVPIFRAVLYEPPFLVDDEQRPRPPADLAARLASQVAQGDRDAALRSFLCEGVGVREDDIDPMVGTPMWSGMLTMAHTTPFDVTITGTLELPRAELGALETPILVLQGSVSPDWMRAGTEALAAALPNGTLGVIEGQGHAGPSTAPDRVATEVERFLTE
jgi:pimeloyl-ACP methyl ester carboxylesterase